MTTVVIPAVSWKVGSPIYYLLGLQNHAYNVYNAGSGYSYDLRTTYAITQTATNSLRFEVRSGDTNWHDVGSGKERSEIGSTEHISYGTPLHISYSFMLEPGAKNTANFMVIGQIHHEFEDNEDVVSPPFAMQLKGERMDAVIRYKNADGSYGYKDIFVDTTDIVRGQTYKIDIYATFDDNNNGRLVLVRDGIVVGDYSGPLGYSTDGSVYWKEGIYRSHAVETVAADYSNLTIDYGDMVQIPAIGATTAVLAVAPSLALTTSSNQGPNGVATFHGVAEAGATVAIYDGETFVKTVTASSDGQYSADVTLNSGTHFFTSATISSSGVVSATSTELPIDYGTSADIVARFSTISAMTGLQAIMLSDSHTLIVSSVAQMKSLISTSAHALSLIDGGYNFGFWSGTPTFRTLTLYNTAGTPTEAFTTSLSNGDVARVTHMIYVAGAYVTMEITDYHIAGQAYSSAYRAFTTGSKLVATEQYRDDGTLVYASYLGQDGRLNVKNYDQSGVLVTETLTLTDGTVYQKNYLHGAVFSEQVTNPEGTTADITDSGTRDYTVTISASQAGLSASDTATAHHGDDVYVVKTAADLVIEGVGGGSDIVYTSVLTYALGSNVESLTFTGTGNAKLAGNDLANAITGGKGDDILDGRAGSDTLTGGSGNDTYIVDNAGDVVVELADGGNDLVLSTVSYKLSDNVERLTLLGHDAINSTGNDLDNVLTGNDANNILDGGIGADTLIGGAGDDTYIVGNPTDVVVELPGGGNDLVISSVSYTLSDNLEQLTLIGQGAISGTGNALDNVIIGNDAGNILDGGVGADTLIGGLGADTFVIDNVGDVVIEAIDGGDDLIRSSVSYILPGNVERLTLTGHDAINSTGNGLSNTLTGNDSDNILDGGAGADMLVGGAGDDTYSVDNVGDIVVELAAGGNDLVLSSVSYTSQANVERLTLVGQDAINGTGNGAANIITGNAASNIIDGGAGADTLIGGGGDDIYVVDDVGDIVVELAGGGDDMVQSSVSFTLQDNVERLTLAGNGQINATGNGLENLLTGNDANNVLDGGLGADTMIGEAGDDIYIVDNVGDVVIELAGGGNDLVQSSISYTLQDNVERLTLVGSSEINATGNSLDNILTGNNANNILDGGLGADTMAGGVGNDIYIVDNIGDIVIEVVGGGNDLVQSSISYSLQDNVEQLSLTGHDAINATGNGLSNILTGNDASNILDGGLGADTMIGGAGDDTYIVDNVGDLVIELTGGGNDLVQSSISYTLQDNVARLTLTGHENIYATGNGLDNILTGNDANNILDGGLGADTMIGGAGDDIYTVDNAGDVIIELAGGGNDLVQSSISYTLLDYVERLSLTGHNAINATGNGLDNILTGNDANNILDGGLGADTMIGGSGDDTYIVNNVGDSIVEQADGGADLVQSSVSFALSDNVEILTLTGHDAVNATGNGLANILTGNDGSNILDGGTGADTMIGGSGDDTYIVDNIADKVIESADGGNDLVQSTVSYTLSDNVERLTLLGQDTINANGNDATNVLLGNDAANAINGGGGDDNIDGGAGNDVLHGGSGNDTIFGGAGNDIIWGDAGVDKLAGGLGADRFIFNNGDSGRTALLADRITDFSHAQGDIIDLSLIDANTKIAGDQAFTFFDTKPSMGVASSIWITHDYGYNQVMGDTNGDGIADLTILVDTPNKGAISFTDFIL